MGKNTDKLYVTHDEHAAGSHMAGSSGKQMNNGRDVEKRLPFDCCALSLQPFQNPVAVVTEATETSPARADVFELLNIVPYIRKFKTHPVTGAPLDNSQLLKINFFKNSEGNYHDPITYRPLSQHTHIVFLRPTGNVYDMASLQLLAIKPKTWRDLVDETPFTRKDIVTIQDPENLGARTLKDYAYVKEGKKVDEGDLEGDPLKGINVDAAGGAAKILRLVAEKSKQSKPSSSKVIPHPKTGDDDEDEEEEKEGVVAVKPKQQVAYNASNFTNGQASASFTSTSLAPQRKNEVAMFDEEEYMFDEMTKATKEKDRQKYKGYAMIQTNLGSLNVELHADRAPKTVFNWIMLAKQGKYDGVIFHRLIPGFMVQGGDPTGTGRGGASYWGSSFRDECDEKGAFTHHARGVMSMANSGPATNGSQFFFTFRATPHLDRKHTVFGQVVDEDSMHTLGVIEGQPSAKGTDRPLKEIKIIGITVTQDPFELYQSALKSRIARNDLSAEALAAQAAKKAKRDSDRTTWLGTDLGVKGKKKKVAQVEGAEEGGVGKYLSGAGVKRPAAGEPPKDAVPTGFPGGGAKKAKKAGGFGDFSGW